MRTISAAPSPLERLATLGGLGDALQFERRANRAVAPVSVWQSSRLYLGSRLPINLRRFLAEELGASMRVENDRIVALEPRPAEALMRELARAIRRFSAERARQAWSECGIGFSRLVGEFFHAPAGEQCPVVLCLRCAWVGAGPLDEHGGRNCLAVNLDSARGGFKVRRNPGNSGNSGAAPSAILQAIEDFRMAREAASLSHYDLDCFAANGQMVFTWHPLPPGL